MKTVQMTLDENLINQVDQEVRKLKTTRSAFTREALVMLLKHHHTLMREKAQIEGYKKSPIKKDEVADWQTEQA